MIMAVRFLFAFLAFVGFSFPLIFAYDPNPLDDFCIAAPDSSAAVFVNGKACKNPKLVTTEDFFLAANFHKPGNTSGPTGAAVNPVNINRFPGLNTMGLSLVRADFAPNGFIAPHVHPRSTEIIFILEGTVYVGFVASNPGNNMKKKLYAKVLNPGDIFVFPKGLIHFQLNVGNTSATGFAAYNSQNFGFVGFGNDFFATDPLISTDLLSKAFQLDKNVIQSLQSKAWIGPNLSI